MLVCTVVVGLIPSVFPVISVRNQSLFMIEMKAPVKFCNPSLQCFNINSHYNIYRHCEVMKVYKKYESYSLQKANRIAVCPLH